MPRFNPVTVTATNAGGGAVTLAVNGTGEGYTFDVDVIRQILLGKDADPRFLLFEIAVGLDAAGFTFAGKTPAQIKAAVEALTNLVWAA